MKNTGTALRKTVATLAERNPMSKMDYLIGNHDLSLSDWGPYAKEFLGLSRIADQTNGHRVDFFMTPGMFRREVFPPDTQRECGLSVWEAAPDLHYYAYRQQLRSKDQVYADISYSRIAENCWLGRCEFVNDTACPWDCTLEIYGGFHPNRQGSVVPHLPEGTAWMNANRHNRLEYSVKRYNDGLTWDGWRRGEEPCRETVTGFCIGQSFGANMSNKAFGYSPGDQIFFTCPVTKADGTVILRYKLEKGAGLELEVTHAGVRRNATLSGSGGFAETIIYRGVLKSDTELSIRSSGGAEIRLDGLMFGDAVNSGEFKMRPAEYPDAPEFVFDAESRTMTLTFPPDNGHYGLWWNIPQGVSRTFYTDDIVRSLVHGYGSRNPYYDSVRHGDESQKFAGVYLIPICLPAKGRKTVYTILAYNDSAMACNAMLSGIDRSDAALEAIFRRERERRIQCDYGASGKEYRLSQQLMAATVFTNLIFPVYAKGRFIRHHVPARYYSTPYSWDSGFIGLALNEFDRTRAMENLNAYVTEPGDEESAFILHGTPLPIQGLLYQDIYNLHHDLELLTFFYPQLRQFYRFLAGRTPGSITRIRGSNLLATWDYFYNSGGWDDYPPQWEYRKDAGNKGVIAPTVSTAYAIRFAKILRTAACRIGNHSDLPEYDADITVFSRALQQYSWDAEAGCFSYVCHDGQGYPNGFFRHSSGMNYNLGMDGASPLAAGVCTLEQQRRLFELLDKCWSRAGLSTVWPGAPYYRSDGYWNGAVWMPHQWLFWKTALDHGRAEFARRIADTALTVWKNEVDDSYYCYEHFSNHTGRGGGSHCFGALSGPVLKWFNAYFRPGRLTGGFDLWIDAESQNGSARTFKIQIDGTSGDQCTLLFVEDRPVKQIVYRDRQVEAIRPRPGLLEIPLEKNSAGILIMEY